MIGILLAGALLAPKLADPYGSARNCAVTRLDQCPNVNALVWDPRFSAMVAAFVGRARVSLIYRGTLDDQQIAVLGGAPEDTRLIGGLYFFAGCRHHSCSEKGAVVLTPSGNIVATAILHSRIFEATSPAASISGNVISIYSRDPAHAARVIDNLTEWALEGVARSPTISGLSPKTLDRVDVYSTASGRPVLFASRILRPDNGPPPPH